MTFLEAGEASYPSAKVDSVNAISEKGSEVTGAAKGNFVSDFLTKGYPSFVADAATAQIKDLSDFLSSPEFILSSDIQTVSLLWLLAREKQLPQTLSRAEQYCREALAWMIDDLVSTRIEVVASYISRGWMQLVIDIYRPTGQAVRFQYNYEWSAQAGKRAA
ncbi:phage GP46 family protein [Pseudomonas sp. NMI795_08]|uniref:phage GP46 family protein n=1 Tax=Pseudomonas sp. NMI795_08 TaxID=2903144 RepID=UPI001E5B725E|nr:phage GP46 family protein [Pseudomonas sp. NMI795_08]MCE1117460.1 phage GP46 family protein [Pseudomonas sp. NMI795_08]